MYKRVAKHAQKKADEEALGLDEDAKDVLGLNDTDDSESDSSSSDGDNASSGSDDEDASQHDRLAKLKRKLSGLYGSDEEAEASGSQSGAADSASDDDDDDDDGDEGPTAQEALQNPLYKIATPAGSQSCAICPGRVFKNAGMAKDHVTSAAHMRRHKRFVASTAALKDNGIDLATVSAASVAAVMTEKPEFASTKKDSAKSRRKRKRDRGGKKKREERERAAPATDKAPSEEVNRPKKSKKVVSEIAEERKQDKSTTRKDKTVLQDRKAVPKSSTSHRTAHPAKRPRRESIPKMKVRVVDVQ